MSILVWLANAEDWLIRKTLPPVMPAMPPYEPDAYDITLSLMLVIAVCLSIAATCGHCLAH